MINITGTPRHVRDIARQLGRLRPDWHNPERYFEERDELERQLKNLANELEARRG
jgi:hypothetical protein